MNFAEIAQELILDHSRHPRNFRDLANADWRHRSRNDVCGDEIELLGRIADGKIVQATFMGAGCAICVASASILTQKITGLSPAEVLALRDRFFRMLGGDDQADPSVLGELMAFQGVSQFPLRVNCAQLPWQALEAALLASDARELPVRQACHVLDREHADCRSRPVGDAGTV